MTQKYELSERKVKEVYGDKFEEKLTLLKEGLDYIQVKDKRCLSGFKRVYRNDILDSIEKKLNLSEQVTNLDVVPVKLELKDEVIFEDEVQNIFPNSRYVRVRSGATVYVGAKGVNMRLGQRISYKDNVMVLRKRQS